MSLQLRAKKRKDAPSAQVPKGSFLTRQQLISPPQKNEGKWKWEPLGGLAVTSMTDAALAAPNAIISVWEGHQVYLCSCAVHASTVWLGKSEHQALLNEKEKSKKKELICKLQ